MSPSGPLDPLNTPAPRVAFLRAQPFAHRGLHGGGLVENGLSAFDAAMAGGFGIECDVQLSRDGVPYVFHDDTLDRLTAHHGAFSACTAKALDAMTLVESGEALPRLAAVLARIDGREPLLIEIKARGRGVGRICSAVRHALEGYGGPVAIMSFNPLVVGWFAHFVPRIVRGLVVTEEDSRGWRGEVRRTLALWGARPDFLAYDIRDLPSRFAARARRRGLPVLTWTVRTAAQQAVALAHADASIFETPVD